MTGLPEPINRKEHPHMTDKNEPVTVTMSRGAWEVTVYLLRRTAHRESPEEYPDRPPYPPFYDGVEVEPWPSDFADTAGVIERRLTEAAAGASS